MEGGSSRAFDYNTGNLENVLSQLSQSVEDVREQLRLVVADLTSQLAAQQLLLDRLLGGRGAVNISTGSSHVIGVSSMASGSRGLSQQLADESPASHVFTSPQTSPIGVLADVEFIASRSKGSSEVSCVSHAA